MAKKNKHKSFRLTPHRYSQLQVFFFLFIASVVGIIIGLVLKDQAAAVLGVSTY